MRSAARGKAGAAQLFNEFAAPIQTTFPARAIPALLKAQSPAKNCELPGRRIRPNSGVPARGRADLNEMIFRFHEVPANYLTVSAAKSTKLFQAHPNLHPGFFLERRLLL